MSRIAVITGTTHGIGQVTARELAQAGCTVIMLCRNVPAAEAVRHDILQVAPGAHIHVVSCDLASLSSVRTAALTVRQQFEQIDLLINNAGMVSTRQRMSVDGFELVFATNHLGPFLLTELLRPAINASGRIINVASVVHYRGQLDLDSVTNPKARYRSIAAYAQSKLANVLHTFALAQRLKDTSITVNCLHPGVVASNLLPRWLRIIKPLFTPVTFDNERGAQTTLTLALSDSVVNISGQYFNEYGVPQTASSLANNISLQESLWSASEQWTATWR